MTIISTSTWVQKEARVPFADLARAVRPLSRMPREDRERVENAHGPCVFMADHAAFGAVRRWSGTAREFVEDPGMGGGWHALPHQPGETMTWISGGSGSVLEATCRAQQQVDLTLRAPVRADGLPHRGDYWDSFHRALGVEEVVWSVVRRRTPYSHGVAPEDIGVEYPPRVLAWAESHGAHVGARGCFVLVCPHDEAGEVRGEVVAYQVGVLPVQDAARIRMALAKGDY